MANRLAPSRSTVYVSNLPFSLTNNDLHKIFEKFGKIVKITIVRDKQWRSSKGIAFILFLNVDDARECVKDTNNREMFGRTLKCSIAKDNGKAADYIRKREYPDKSHCYECGQEGHLSYGCPSNTLGERKPPPKKPRMRKKKLDSHDETLDDENLSENSNQSDTEELETLSAVIKYEQMKYDGHSQVEFSNNQATHRKKIKKDSYFSDEEVSD